MGTIVIENFATQSSNSAYQNTSTILKEAGTGYQWAWNGSAWERYFGLVQGNNVTITPLVSGVPKGSVASNLVVNSPFVYPVIAPLSEATSMATLPAINVTYGIQWHAPCTGVVKSFQFYSTPTDGTLEIALYTENTAFMAKTGMQSTVTKRLVTLNLNQDISGAAISSPTVTGGQIYFVTVRSSVLAGMAMIPVSNTNFNPPVQCGYTVNPSTPTSLSGNATNVTAFPFLNAVFA